MGDYRDLEKRKATSRAYNQRPGSKARHRRYRLNTRIARAGRAPGPGCELCGTEFLYSGERGRGPQFDHCHTTGKFRGWLCMNCNTALGLLNDDPDLLRLALAYLNRNK